MSAFKTAKWIWYTSEAVPDSYGDFKDSFNYSGENAVCNISVDGDYELYINGEFVASNQYGDFEHYKIYDAIDISDFLKHGENEIYILVWHLGINSSRYRFAPAGLLYEILLDGVPVAASNTDTAARKNPNYRSNYGKMITGQLGQSFLYDASAPETCYGSSVIVEKHCNMYVRPIKKLELKSPLTPSFIKQEGDRYLFDLGQESVGFPYFEIDSGSLQGITLSWGEHIADGWVRRKVGGRDFSFEYIANVGANTFINRMLRLGCRYIEIQSEKPITIKKLSFIPQVFPVEEKKLELCDPIDNDIYRICVNSLKLCMLEHYVDTPWREQAFYSFDSRNQMLCGYKAFADGNRDYARAALLLMSKDTHDDGLLSITYPNGNNLAIPSFSLHYFVSVKEYLENTDDVGLAAAVFDKLSSLIDIFIKQINSDGILESFSDKKQWNFYDWSPYMSSEIGKGEAKPDIMINCLFIIAAEAFKYICRRLGKPFPYQSIVDNVRVKAGKAFYNSQSGLFFVSEQDEECTELANALAVLSGLADREQSEYIAEKLVSGELLECSLSNKCFKYDALLYVDEKYRCNIIDEIRTSYAKMLEKGNGTVWEVIDGESAFDNAGSLCHGWSAVPILYLK